jgi:hypothetical protein
MRVSDRLTADCIEQFQYHTCLCHLKSLDARSKLLRTKLSPINVIKATTGTTWQQFANLK